MKLSVNSNKVDKNRAALTEIRMEGLKPLQDNSQGGACRNSGFNCEVTKLSNLLFFHIALSSFTMIPKCSVVY